MNAAALRVLIVAGGTGGHIFPALAIAEELRRRQAEVVWLGTGGMELKWVITFPLHIVPFSSPSGVLGLWRLTVAVCRAVAVLVRLRPAVVLAMGSYASVPGGLAARLLRKPLVIHEQNAVAGRANRLLSRVATVVLSGFPAALPKAVHIGNPVRQCFTDAANKRQPVDDGGVLRLLVLGGSQGAEALNASVPAALALLLNKGGIDWQVRHQCGAGKREETLRAYSGLSPAMFEVDEFIGDVAAAIREADLVLCRAGASTLAELTAVGAAALLVPYPHAAANHQKKNADFFRAQKAAIVCDESALTPQWLADFLYHTDKSALAEIAQNCRGLAKPAAAADIAAYCLNAAEGRHAA